MKNFVLTVLVCVALGMGNGIAQGYKPFKVGIGVGYGAPGNTGAGVGGGALFYIEPAYRASTNIAVGLRLESAVIARGVTGVGDDDVKGDANSNFSYTLNGQFYLSDRYVRPFIGVGGGLYNLAAVDFNTGPNSSISAREVESETRLGFYPRIGVDAGHFNLTIDYNIVPKTDVPGIGSVTNNYLGIKAGVTIGGGVGEKRDDL